MAEQLHLVRCARHPLREAAARCVGCGGDFCRECATEHSGRILCADCLGRETVVRAKRKVGLASAGRLLALSFSFGLTWAIFHLVGKALLAVPAVYHDGSFWQRIIL